MGFSLIRAWMRGRRLERSAAVCDVVDRLLELLTADPFREEIGRILLIVDVPELDVSAILALLEGVIGAEEMLAACCRARVAGDEQVCFVVGREERRADGGDAEGALDLARDDGDLRSLLRRDGLGVLRT